ncbi:sensor domain-containing diguanylate cyclase [Endozoicomonas sp. SM1973]|uniref:diguanylate cyclase n=1 Tax=Spartinivicinus marinus TaxID=2994442 RepID=A0A853IKJ4_9GAMM|nr:diguanylate cyclase [Spartinivicinus marinus]MCX4027559.1 diguanylate cyclase [Spartinivicinus marinus]NYZ68196.1 sensor domain-containing diguanylate cyclase [Spartinivicinus marinus]
MAVDTGFKELHWMMGMLQDIEVGLVVVDRDYKIQIWNSFMENHSGKNALEVRGENVFDLFGEIPKDWFLRKTESVFLLKNKTFSTWEQRPFIFRFKNFRPITGTEEFMYQNLTINPLMSADGTVNHICILIYDVTDIAVNKKGMEQANSQLEVMSRTDRLTGLYNRGYWEECLIREFHRYLRTKQKSTLVMFDIDHFKKVNDTYGHQAGDEVIKTVAKLLQENQRTSDITGRYGGEEYGAILVNTKAEDGMYFSERLRKKISESPVAHHEHAIQFTISLGLAEISEKITSIKEWIEAADQALYQSKEGGRNRSTLYTIS